MISVEEKIEDYIKNELTKLGLKYYTKTEMINLEIEKALKDAPSKNGGQGGNRPDIKLLIEDIPIIIEVKGNIDKLIKKYLDPSIPYDPSGKTDLFKLDMSYNAINSFACNGAIHYCNSIIANSHYDKGIAIGIAGNQICGKLNIIIWSYLIERDKEAKLLKDVSNKRDLTYLCNLKNYLEKENKNEISD